MAAIWTNYSKWDNIELSDDESDLEDIICKRMEENTIVDSPHTKSLPESTPAALDADIIGAISMNNITGVLKKPYTSCPLCGGNGPFARSHIMSENLLKLGGSWSRPFLHHGQTTISPHAMSRKLFCRTSPGNKVSCEQSRFSPSESSFLKGLVNPFLDKGNTCVDIKYGKWLFYNGVSLAYRYLIANNWNTSVEQFRKPILHQLAALSLVLKPYLLDEPNYTERNGLSPTHCSGIFVGLTAYDQSARDLAYIGIAECTFCIVKRGTTVSVGVLIMVYGLHLFVTSDKDYFENTKNLAVAESYTFFDIDSSGGEFTIPALADRKFHAQFCYPIDWLTDSYKEVSAQHHGLAISEEVVRHNDTTVDNRVTRNINAAMGENTISNPFRLDGHHVFSRLPPLVFYDRSMESSDKLGCIRLDGSGYKVRLKKYIDIIPSLYVWYCTKERDNTNFAIVRVQEDPQLEGVFCFKYKVIEYGTRCIFEPFLSEEGVHGLQPVKDAVRNDIIETLND